MQKQVIVIFDIGKTNKKLLLFDETFNLISQEETVFNGIPDDDGFACEDIDAIINWINSSLKRLISSKRFNIKALNFSTYGATIVFLDRNGKRVTPVYNYLKPMPEDLLTDFYRRYSGPEEFARATASPLLGMLNSGLQIYWLKYKKPELWAKVGHILHLPQYISYLFTGKIVSDYTSIGCHTALWDFQKMKYHKWLSDENIVLPQPQTSDMIFTCNIFGKEINTGIGIHDSSASLVPYLKAAGDKKNMLVSTGTWIINMNPYNEEPLTPEELKRDCLCYLGIDKRQVKSSRLFLGHIHDIYSQKLTEHFNVKKDAYTGLSFNSLYLEKLVKEDNHVFFPEGLTENFPGNFNDMDKFKSFSDAYYQLVYELAKFEEGSIRLVLGKSENIEDIYITGGFSKNKIFCELLAKLLNKQRIHTTEIQNSTALGAAMVVAIALNKNK